MLTLLFTPDQQRLAPLIAPQKRLFYPVLLADIIRAASDSIDALVFFGDLITGRRTDPESVGYMAFDGHIGDTSCQLRACMVRELILYHRRILQQSTCSTEYPHWVAGTIHSLQELIQNAKSTCLQLTKGRVDPSKLGLSNKTETRASMLQKLGWEEPNFEISTGFDSAGEYDTEYDCGASETETESSDSTPMNDSSQGSPFTAMTMSSLGNTHDGLSMGSTPGDTCDDHSCPRAFLDLGAVDRKLVESSSDVGISLTHTASCNTSSLWMPWSLTDVSTIVRFLTYTYSLSKYKRFGLQQIRDPQAPLSSRLVMRLEPDIAASYGKSLLDGVYDPANPHYTEKALSKSQRINTEFLAAQGWVSELSCAWLSATAERLGNFDLQRLLAETRRTSAKGLVSVPSYVGYLVLREYWARNLIPNLIVDRRFCEHGFHINYFLATPQITSGRNNFGNPHATLGLSVKWSLQHIKDSSELPQDTDAPYIVVMGNSLDGNFADYMKRFQYTCSHTGPCGDNSTHIEEFLASDQDRLALAIFADHPHYAFPLGAKEEELGGEIPVVAAAMENVVPGLQAQWKKSKDEIVQLGAGESLRLFMWQHVLLETGDRVMSMLEGRTSIMPLTAAV